MKTKTLLVAIAALALIFTACKKKDSAAAPSKTSLLTTHDWVPTSIGPDRNGDGNIDSNAIESCDTDNYIRFATNFQYTQNVGSVV